MLRFQPACLEMHENARDVSDMHRQAITQDLLLACSQYFNSHRKSITRTSRSAHVDKTFSNVCMRSLPRRTAEVAVQGCRIDPRSCHENELHGCMI